MHDREDTALGSVGPFARAAEADSTIAAGVPQGINLILTLTGYQLQPERTAAWHGLLYTGNKPTLESILLCLAWILSSCHFFVKGLSASQQYTAAQQQW